MCHFFFSSATNFKGLTFTLLTPDLSMTYHHYVKMKNTSLLGKGNEILSNTK